MKKAILALIIGGFTIQGAHAGCADFLADLKKGGPDNLPRESLAEELHLLNESNLRLQSFQRTHEEHRKAVSSAIEKSKPTEEACGKAKKSYWKLIDGIRTDYQPIANSLKGAEDFKKFQDVKGFDAHKSSCKDEINADLGVNGGKVAAGSESWSGLSTTYENWMKKYCASVPL